MYSKLESILVQNFENLIKINKNTLNKLNRLGLKSVLDLLTYFPFRYTDTSNIIKIEQLFNAFNINVDLEKQRFTILVKFTQISKIVSKRGIIIIAKCYISENTENKIIECIWFNQEYLLKTLKKNTEYIVYGKILQKSSKRFSIFPEVIEEYKDNFSSLNIGSIVPEYYTTKGLSKKIIRKYISEIIKLLETTEKSRLELELFNLIKEVHFPSNQQKLYESRKSLAIYELCNLKIKTIVEENITNSYNIEISNSNNINNIKEKFLSKLEFAPTEDQINVINFIINKITNKEGINALLQGDVGSGKTLIIQFLCYLCAQLNYSSILLVPTTILAEQHFNNFLKISKNEFKTTLVTSNSKNSIQELNPQVIIATSALLNKDIRNLKIGSLIIDEQHKFGVEQRERILKIKNSYESIPNYLNVTATPIPRTMAQIIYGNIEILVLRTKPNKKTKVRTFIIPESKIQDCYNWLKTKIKKENSKIFWVCSAVNPKISDDSDNNLETLKTVEGMYKILKSYFSDCKIEKLHGKLPNKNKGEIINLFKESNIEILICSSVIEVGIDISDADIVIIENPERFGLAQLHQIRGRVGRGQKESFCLLMVNNNISEAAKNRIDFFARNTDGVKIAEFDLLQRGPGEVYGNLQSGIPNFKICTIKDFVEHKEEINSKTRYLLETGINKIPFF